MKKEGAYSSHCLVDDEVAKREYIENGLNVRQIGLKYGWCPETVKWRLKRAGVYAGDTRKFREHKPTPLEKRVIALRAKLAELEKLLAEENGQSDEQKAQRAIEFIKKTDFSSYLNENKEPAKTTDIPKPVMTKPLEAMTREERDAWRAKVAEYNKAIGVVEN